MKHQIMIHRIATAVLFMVTALLIFLVGPFASADTTDERDFLVLDAVENRMTGPPLAPAANLYPEPSGGMALLPEPDPESGDHHYRLLKVAGNRLDQIKQRLALLRHSPPYAARRTRYFGRSQEHPAFLQQIFFTRTLSITESRCNCVKTFPFEVFGSPPDTPIGYGCFFDYARPEYLNHEWPAREQPALNDRGIIKAPIHWGYDLCQSDVREITVECSMELSRQGVPIGPVNYSATPIAVRTADHLYLVRQVPGDYPQDIKDCGMETRAVIHGYPVAEISDAGDVELLDKIKADTLNQLVGAFTNPPLNAQLEVTLSDEAILACRDQKNPLMTGRYESSGYLVRVYSGDGTVYVLVRYHVLAGEQPDGPFHIPSKEEMERYVDAIQEAVLSVQASIRKSYEPRLESDESHKALP